MRIELRWSRGMILLIFEILVLLAIRDGTNFG